MKTRHFVAAGVFGTWVQNGLGLLHGPQPFLAFTLACVLTVGAAYLTAHVIERWR
jgi:peptidoglycan/LPS O-acetylase OafA/YrhL